MASDHLRGTASAVSRRGTAPNDARDELGLVAAHRKVHVVEDVLEVVHEEIVIADARRHEARDELALVAAPRHAKLLAVVAQLRQPEDLEVLRGYAGHFSVPGIRRFESQVKS